MKKTKFSVNALLLILLIFSVIAFFFTVTMERLADRTPVNQFLPVEGSPYAVRYSSVDPNGLYKGMENDCELIAEGDFGSGWGAFAAGDTLLLNEYRRTDLDLMFCDVVTVDARTGKKDVLLRDSLLRGVCASGEPVCVRGCMMPSNAPGVNSLCRLYRLTSDSFAAEPQAATLVYLDPETLEVVAELPIPDAYAPDFEALYLDRTMEEVTK